MGGRGEVGALMAALAVSKVMVRLKEAAKL